MSVPMRRRQVNQEIRPMLETLARRSSMHGTFGCLMMVNDG